MTKKILRTYRSDGSRTVINSRVVVGKRDTFLKNPRRGGGNIFRRTENAYRSIYEACDGKNWWRAK